MGSRIRVKDGSNLNTGLVEHLIWLMLRAVSFKTRNLSLTGTIVLELAIGLDRSVSFILQDFQLVIILLDVNVKSRDAQKNAKR
jgi:hypothetical protein